MMIPCSKLSIQVCQEEIWRVVFSKHSPWSRRPGLQNLQNHCPWSETCEKDFQASRWDFETETSFEAGLLWPNSKITLKRMFIIWWSWSDFWTSLLSSHLLTAGISSHSHTQKFWIFYCWFFSNTIQGRIFLHKIFIDCLFCIKY